MLPRSGGCTVCPDQSASAATGGLRGGDPDAALCSMSRRPCEPLGRGGNLWGSQDPPPLKGCSPRSAGDGGAGGVAGGSSGYAGCGCGGMLIGSSELRNSLPGISTGPGSDFDRRKVPMFFVGPCTCTPVKSYALLEQLSITIVVPHELERHPTCHWQGQWKRHQRRTGAARGLLHF